MNIDLGHATYEMIKDAYEKAVKEDKDIFIITYNGYEKELLTSYAKYLLQYMADKLGRDDAPA